MDIWLTVCRKTVPKCSYCEEPIQLDEVMVAGRLWKTSKEEGKRWVKNFHWHAQKVVIDLLGNEEDRVCCWLVAGLDYLHTHPTTETRGRRQLELTKKQKTERLKILRQRARLVQKIKLLMEIPLSDQSEEDTASMIKVGSQIMELKERIASVGGVPKTWE